MHMVTSIFKYYTTWITLYTKQTNIGKYAT